MGAAREACAVLDRQIDVLYCGDRPEQGLIKNRNYKDAAKWIDGRSAGGWLRPSVDGVKLILIWRKHEAHLHLSDSNPENVKALRYRRIW